MSPGAAEIAKAAETIAAIYRNLELLQDFIAETVADEALQPPPVMTVVLVSDDDPTLAEDNIASGLAIREGKNVYFHHFHRIDSGLLPRKPASSEPMNR